MASKKPASIAAVNRGLGDLIRAPDAWKNWHVTNTARDAKRTIARLRKEAATGRELLAAAEALEARGWFKPHGCADAGTRRDIARMAAAIKAARDV